MSFTNPQKKKSRGIRSGNKRISYQMIRKLTVQKGMNVMGEVNWCTI